MCGKRLRTFLVLSGFFFLACLLPCYSDVVLTDEEQKEIMNSLNTADAIIQIQEDLLKKLKTDCQKLETDYTTLQDNYDAQVKSSETLKEEVRKYKTKSFVTTFTSIGLGILLCVIVF